MRNHQSSTAALRALFDENAAVAFDWNYWMCPLDSEAGLFGPFADLVGLWQSRRPAGGGLPRRKDFRAEEFAGWMGRIFIAEVQRDPFDLRFTLWGTLLAEWWRVDYTGRTLGAEAADPDAWSVEKRYFAEMDRKPFLGLAGGSLSEYGRGHIKVLGLDLPLSDDVGRLDRVLSAHLRLNAGDDLFGLLRNCPRSRFDR